MANQEEHFAGFGFNSPGFPPSIFAGFGQVLSMAKLSSPSEKSEWNPMKKPDSDM